MTDPQQVEVHQDILETHPSGQSSQNVLQKILYHQQTDAIKPGASIPPTALTQPSLIVAEWPLCYIIQTFKQCFLPVKFQ